MGAALACSVLMGDMCTSVFSFPPLYEELCTKTEHDQFVVLLVCA